MYINLVVVRGRLGEKPTLMQTNSGKSLLKMSVGQNYKKKDTELQETLWHKVVVWDEKAESLIKKIDKGVVVHVTGRLKYSKYKLDNGYEVKASEIVATDVVVLGDLFDPVKPNGEVNPNIDGIKLDPNETFVTKEASQNLSA